MLYESYTEEFPNLPPFEWNDGGREDAGFKGYTGDCVIRAIAIATGIDYKYVYDTVKTIAKNWKGNTKKAERIRAFKVSRGTPVALAEKFLFDNGWVKVKGKLRVDDNKFKTGNFVLSVRSHFASMKDGIYMDTWDSRMTLGGIVCHDKDGNINITEPTPKTVFCHYIQA